MERAIMNIGQVISVKKTYLHTGSGNKGEFIKEFTNRFGQAILIKLSDGREYFAPKKEFIVL